MANDVRIANLIISLNRMTSENQISWNVLPPPNSIARGTDNLVTFYAQTSVSGKLFGIYEYRYKIFTTEYEHFFWSESVSLIMLDSFATDLWQNDGHTSLLYDLLATIRRRVSGIDSIIDDILRKPNN